MLNKRRLQVSEMKNVYKIFMVKPEVKRIFQRPRNRP